MFHEAADRGGIPVATNSYGRSVRPARDRRRCRTAHQGVETAGFVGSRCACVTTTDANR